MRNCCRGLLVLVILLCELASVPYVYAAQTEASKQPKYLNYVTLPSGTTHYTIAVVQGKTITEQSGVRVMVQPANGPMALPSIVGSRQADLTIGNSLTVYWAYNGLVDFKEPHRFVRISSTGLRIERFG